MVERLRHDPDLFAETFLNRRLWSEQSAILNALHDSNVAVRSCVGVGKTAVAAQAVVQAMMVPNTIVVTTAPTARQVESILWGEIRSMLLTAATRSITLPSDQAVAVTLEGLTNTQWTITDKWFAIGASTDQPERLAGYHSDRVLVVIEEASGVEEEIWHVLRGCVTNPQDRILAISNPTREDGPFYDIFNDSRMSGGWRLFHIDGEELPWVVNRQPPPASGLTTWQWVEARKLDWGVKWPNEYQIRVRGEFASDAGNLLLSRSEIRAATKADVQPGEPSVLAVDVAVSGDDETALCLMRGPVQAMLHTHRKAGTMETTGFIVRFLDSQAVDVVVIDAIGVGRGVYDRLCELRNDRRIKARVVAFQGSEKPKMQSGEMKYLNRRAESYFHSAERIKDGAIRLLDDDLQTAQLAYQPYTTHSDGRLKLLSKAEIKTKGRSSPDRADALVMAVASMEYEAVLMGDIILGRSNRIFATRQKLGRRGLSWV